MDAVVATAAKAETTSGKILKAPMEIPSVGKFCAMQNPSGAAFAIIKLEEACEAAQVSLKITGVSQK